MPTDAQIKSVLESVTKTKDQEIAELLEVNQQLDRDCTKLAIRNAQLVIEVEQLKEQFDLVLAERNEAMDEAASAKSVHETLVRNITSMSEFAGKAMRERDELAQQLEDSRATVALLNRKLARLGMAWADDEDRHAVVALSEDADRFRDERDRARRLVCELQCDPPERFIGLPHEVAQMYGWSCFDVTECRKSDATTDESSPEAP